MPYHNYYQKQVELLLDVIPSLNQLEQFALKGGTAINLFVQNMPRLSIDIDLTYIPIEPRNVFLKNLSASFDQLQNLILAEYRNKFTVNKIQTKNGDVLKLLVRGHGVEIKIEPSLVFRGFVYPCEQVILCKEAQNQFLRYVKTTMVSKADLYAGKICAALNRQHPRDLFDIKLLFDNDGLDEKIRKAFIYHVACDSRPISEMLNPNRLDIASNFMNEFQGMTNISITLNELLEARERLFSFIKTELTDNERKFLYSIKLGEPDWSMMEMNLEHLPALQWKLMNIRNMDPAKHKISADKLKAVLGL